MAGRQRDPRDHHRRRDRHRRQIAKGKPDCALCGEPIDYDAHYLDPLAFEVDHVIPIAQGGADVLANKQAAHRRCNREAGAKRTQAKPAVWFITDRNWTVHDSISGA